MKLNQIKKILTINLPILKIKTESIANTSRIRFFDVGILKRAIDDIENTEIFNFIIIELKTTALFLSSILPNQEVDSIEYQKIRQLLDRLYYSIEAFINAIDKSIPDETENCISIVIPDKDFDKLVQTIEFIDKFLKPLIVSEEINGEISINNVDNGSVWLTLSLGLPLAVSLLGSIAWASAVIYKKFLEGRAFAQHVQELKLKNEHADEIFKKQQELIDLMIINESEAIRNKYFTEKEKNKESAQEITERLKQSIKSLAELNSKGVEIHPSILAPENINNLFPNLQNIQAIESKIKQITEGGANIVEEKK